MAMFLLSFASASDSVEAILQTRTEYSSVFKFRVQGELDSNSLTGD